MTEALKTKTFKAHFIPRIAEKIAGITTDGNNYETVTAELHKSGAFDYGNGTCLVLDFTNLPPACETRVVYDTRYMNISDFDALVSDVLADRFGENLDHLEEVTA